MNDETPPDPTYMMRQLQTGINAMSKSLSALEDRVTGLESDSRLRAVTAAAAGDGMRRDDSGAAAGGSEGRTFAIRSRTIGEGETAETEIYVTNCRFLFGRRIVVIEDDFILPVRKEGEATVICDGKYYLTIPHDDPDSASISDDPGDGNDYMTTVIPLFEYEDGVMVDDYRGLPTIPVYETDEDIEAANEMLTWERPQ